MKNFVNAIARFVSGSGGLRRPQIFAFDVPHGETVESLVIREATAEHPCALRLFTSRRGTKRTGMLETRRPMPFARSSGVSSSK